MKHIRNRTLHSILSSLLLVKPCSLVEINRCFVFRFRFEEQPNKRSSAYHLLLADYFSRLFLNREKGGSVLIRKICEPVARPIRADYTAKTARALSDHFELMIM